MWVTGFCVSVLVALGSEALAARPQRLGVASALDDSAAGAGHLGALQALASNGLRTVELALGLLAVSIVLAAAALPRRLPLLRLVGIAFAASLLFVPPYALYSLYPSSASLRSHEALFERLRAKTRARLAHVHRRQRRPAKSLRPDAQIGVAVRRPDHHGTTSRRPRNGFAEFLVMMREGVPMRSVNAYYYALRGWIPPDFNRNLLDLAAGRYVVVDADSDGVAHVLTPSPSQIDQDATVRVYETSAHCRARSWVPRVQVIPSATSCLAGWRCAGSIPGTRRSSRHPPRPASWESPARWTRGAAPSASRATIPNRSPSTSMRRDGGFSCWPTSTGTAGTRP
jgi:hypothetical protein